MGVVLRDTASYYKNLGGLVAQAVSADETTGAIDTQESPEEILVVINAGTCTDGAYRVKLLQDDSADGSFANAVYTSETFSTTNDEKIVIASVRNFKRYLKVKVEETSAGTTGMVIGVAVLGVDKFI